MTHCKNIAKSAQQSPPARENLFSPRFNLLACAPSCPQYRNCRFFITFYLGKARSFISQSWPAISQIYPSTNNFIMNSRAVSLPGKPPHIIFTESRLLDSQSNLGASRTSSIILSPTNYNQIRRAVTPTRMIVPSHSTQFLPRYNPTAQYFRNDVPKTLPAPKNTYDIILRKGQDFYNFDEDIDNIFRVFSLPSWISNRYGVTIQRFAAGADGIPCYETLLKVNAKYNAPRTKMYFFEVEKDLVNKRVTYYIQTTRSPFKRVNCLVVEGKMDLINEFLVIKIHDYEDFFKDNFQRPYQELFQFFMQGHKLNELSYPYIEPVDISCRQDNEEHYFVMFRGGAARSSVYLGAYRAMLDLYPKFPQKLRGIITASAGSLISLAISTAEAPQYISQLLAQLSYIGQRDRTVKCESEVIKKQLHYEQIQLKIKEVLYDYGIMQTETFDLLHETLWNNPLVISKLLTAVAGSNITLKQAMTIQTNSIQNIPVVTSSGITSHTNLIPALTHKASLENFYGLLDGYLLKGQYVIELASRVLTRFLIRKLREDPRLVAAVLRVNPTFITEADVKAISIKLTMRQLFEINGEMQYTVVSVDAESQILRFLNQKTTPNLPVVNAIQISFAMPFLVKLPKWKRSWGKYYVHYRNRRKEVDLTGHIFMDGSLMDSSPLLYLQNQRLRQIFFSRKPNEFSKVMCFGANYSDEQMAPAFSREGLFMEFFQVLKKVAPAEQLYRISKCVPPPTFFPFQSLAKPTDIPIVGIFTTIEQSLKNASDNIIKQTFAVRSHLFPENCNFADFLVTGKTAYDIDQKYRAYHALRDSVHELKDALFSLNLNRNSILKVLVQIMQKLGQPQYQQDPRYILRIKRTVLQEISAHAMYSQEEKKRYRLAQMRGGMAMPEFEKYTKQLDRMMVDVLDDVKLIYRFGYFYRERFMIKDAKNLQNTYQKIIDIYTIDETAPPALKPHLKQYIESFFMIRKLEQYNELNSLATYLDRYLLSMGSGHFSTYSPQQYKLNEVYKNFRFQSMPEFLEFSQRLEELNETLIIQDRAFQKQKEHTRFYIDGVLKRRSNNNLHIVFQSLGFHSKYLVETYKLINQVIVFDHYQATDELYEEMARMIIHQNEEIQIKKRTNLFQATFTVEDLVKFIVIRADLNEYLRTIMPNLDKAPMPRAIDLGYIQYDISEDLELKLLKIFSQHFQNKCAVRAITTSGFSSFFSFLIAAGVDDDTIESQLWSFKEHFVINTQEILIEYQRMDWCLKEEMLIRDLQQLLWRNRYDVWANMEQTARQFRIKLDLERIKQEFEESREPIIKSFTDVMNHITASARQSNSSPDPASYFRRANSLRVYEDYYRINKQMSLETKRVISMLMMMFQEQIRVIIMYLSLPKIQQIIELQDDPLKREAMWRGVIITHFIKSDRYKRHIQATLKRINLPPEIKMKEFYDVIPTKIDISINAIDFSQGKYVFINRYTYPQMPLWAALIVGGAYPLIFAEVGARKSWMYHISLENTQSSRRLFFDETPENQRRAPLFGSGSLVDSFPLSLLTNPKVIESSFNNNEYTFLNFGLRTAPPRTHKMLGFYCRRFLDMYELRQLFSGPNKVPYIYQLSQIFMKHSNMLNSYVTSHDKLMQELYNPIVIRLPSRVDMLQYYRLVPSDKLNWQTQQQAYFCTYEKFVPNRRMCFLQVKYIEYTTHLYFISKDKYRTDIFADYNVYFKFRLEDSYEQIPLQYLIVFNLSQYQIIYIKFCFIKDKDLVIKEGQYIIDLTTLRNFVKLDAVYQINYTEIFNKLVAPTKLYSRIFKPPSTNQFGDQIIVRSNVNVKKHGLFCQICCNPLVLNQLLFFEEYGRHKCLCCQKIKPTKYICQTGNCKGAYCLDCVKDELFIKHIANTTCNLGHQLIFKGTKRSKEPKQFIRCQCCFEPNSFYYEDTVCGIKICNECFTEINIDAETPQK